MTLTGQGHIDIDINILRVPNGDSNRRSGNRIASRRVRLGVRTANRKAVIIADIMTLAPLRNRRQAGGEALISRIAEGHSRFTWDGRQGFGMAEYIERVENGKLAGYPL